MSRLLSRSISLMALAFLASASVANGGCSSGSAEDVGDGAGEAFTGTPDNDIGQFFMIEHFGVQAGGFPDVHSAIKQKNLGALILWNPTNETGDVVRQMVKGYAATAAAAGRPELFVSADQEEAATQRFKSRHGFTDLVSGATLGRVVEKNGDPSVCELQARITARELAAVGMNMALGTVSDIFTADSGTRGMFKTRAIDSKSDIVAECIKAMTKGYSEEGHVVFITKHFPGLGNASGNTDVDPTVHTFSNTKDKEETELAPYRAATGAVNADDTFPLFGAMVSHAEYEIIDKSKTPATLSHVILHDFLRGDAAQEAQFGEASFNGIGLKGVTVSDAFWTWGATQHISTTAKQRLMARSFVAGMDILMIAHADFNGAWDYFQQLNAGTLPAAEQKQLASDAGEPDFATFQEKFKARVVEASARIKASKDRVGKIATFVKTGAATTASTDLVPEYQKLTR
jgi:beta-glucosidase-like glycosyl hydrolase